MIARLLSLFAAIAASCALAAATSAAEITIGLGAEVTTLDPHYLNAAPNNSIAEQIFDTLIRHDARQRLIPGLAESWRVVDDLTWEFKLRKGVKFHDGSDFTAADVVFSLDRPAALASPGGFTIYTRALTEKIIIDPYTIRLKTATPYPNMPTDMGGVIIVSSKIAKGATTADFDSGKATIGTGPWKLVRFGKGDRIELARNDGYWGGKAPWDKVTLRLITSDPSRIAALLAGDVQLIEVVPTADYARLKNNNDISIFTTTSNRMIHLHLDSHRDRSPFVTDKTGKPLDKNPLQDARVRRAISKAINRPAIVERVMEGVAIPAGQLVPNDGFFGYVPDLKPEPFDPDGAKKLLAEAGYPDGFGITLHGPNNRYVNDEQIVQAIAQMLTRIGIVTRVETLPFSVYVSRANKLEFSAALLGWGVTTGEATYPLRSLVATYNRDKGLGTWNWGRYSNPKMDALLEQGLATVDNARREKLLQQATELVINDYGLDPLHYQVNTWAARKGLVYTPRTDERTYAHEVRPAP